MAHRIPPKKPHRKLPLKHQKKKSTHKKKKTHKPTQPNPKQNQTPQPPVTFEVRDSLPLITGIIRDNNGNPVPDGTMVEFFYRFSNEELSQKEVTRNGIAKSSFLLDRSGSLEVRVESQPAIQSQVMRFDILPGNAVDPEPTSIISPTETVTEAPTATSTPITNDIPEVHPPKLPSIGDWFLAILLSGVFSSSIYLLTAQYSLMLWGLRSAFLALIGGLLFYTYLAFGLPGSYQLLEETGSWGVLGITITGAILGWLIAFMWQRWSGIKR